MNDKRTIRNIDPEKVKTAELRAKIIYTVITGILLLGLYCTIFSFSASDGEASSEVSYGVTEQMIRSMEKWTGFTFSFADTPEEIEQLESIVRKLAHFTEYAAMGFLMYGIVLCWIPATMKNAFITAGIVVLSAGADEFHQYFVPGRYSSFKDVMIDFAGGIVGMLFIYFLRKLRNYVRIKRGIC